MMWCDVCRDDHSDGLATKPPCWDKKETEMKTRINGVPFSIEGDYFYFGHGRHNCSMDRSDFRRFADWLQDCCDEMEGGEIVEYKSLCGFVGDGKETRLWPRNFGGKKCCSLLSHGQPTHKGNPLTADQCDELAKQLRRVARWDRKRRAEETEREAKGQQAKVKALIKEFGVDRLRDIVDELEPGPFTGENK